jgi:ATP-dependent DNA ligase
MSAKSWPSLSNETVSPDRKSKKYRAIAIKIAPHPPRSSSRARYIRAMLKFNFNFCLPTLGKAVPAGPEWFHEIKYDGYRLRLEREAGRILSFGLQY